MIAFGAPMMMALFLLYLGIAATIPFVSGLMGFSRRVPLLMPAILIGGLIYLEVATFSNDLKYQGPYSLMLARIGVTALGAIELFIVFVLAHWLGIRCRGGFLWVRDRLR